MTAKIGIVTGLVLVVIITFTLTNSDLSTGHYFDSTVVVKGNIHALQGTTNHSSSSSSHNADSTPSLILQRLLRDKYPECQVHSSPLMEPIRWKTMGFYENSSNPVPPYDHVSCFLMKARYNCAYRPDAPFDMAYKHELVFRFPDTTKNCYLKQLIADTLEEWNTVLKDRKSQKKRGENGERRQRQQQQRRYHVMLHGTSYLRQIFEALVCKVSSNNQKQEQERDETLVPITDFIVQLGGADVSQKGFATRHNHQLTVDKLGQPLSNWSLVQTLGCHGDSRSDISAYYRRKAIVPPNLADCNDNIGMIELGEEWRFYYVFRPTMYTPETLENIYMEWFSAINKTNDDDAYWLLWNNAPQEAQNVSVDFSSRSTKIRQWSLNCWMWTLRDLQLRDLGVYFGANNPWITKPPDYHACMPGTPDDQVNLMLFLLWSGYEMDC